MRKRRVLRCISIVAILTVLLFSATAGGEDVFVSAQSTNGLVLLYHLNAAGTTVIDSSGNGNDGNVIGPTFVTNGKFDGAFSFDGSNDYLNVPSTPSLENLSTLTYAAWIFPTKGGNREIFSKARSYHEMRIGGTAPGMYLRGCIEASGGFACSTSSNGLIAPNTWQFVAMTYDNGGDRTVHLFVNGAEVTYSSQLTASGSIASDAASTQNIGRRSNGDRYFGGKLDEVAIWNRALSSTEIAGLFLGGVIAPPTLTSIAVAPASASVQQGHPQQFTAQATFSDNSTADITATATWVSSNTTVATIDPLGRATGVSTGTTNITATQDGVGSNITVLDVTVTVWSCQDDTAWPGTTWPTITAKQAGWDTTALQAALDYANTKGPGNIKIVWNGCEVVTVGNQSDVEEWKSTTKTIGMFTTFIAERECGINITDRAVDLDPSFASNPPGLNPGWANMVRLYHLGSHTAGFENQGGYGDFLYEPGAAMFYTDGGPNRLARAITIACGQDLEAFMFTHLFTPIGITAAHLGWRDPVYGIPTKEFNSGISGDADAAARLGLMWERGGRWNGSQLIDETLLEMACNPLSNSKGLPLHQLNRWPGMPNHYGWLAWNNDDLRLPNVPRDMCTSWGLFESFITIVPSKNLVVVRLPSFNGDSWRPAGSTSDFYDVYDPFISNIVAAIP